jgi:hypothetical protein
MPVRQITTQLALNGETQFKKAMAGVNASLREMKSELALSEAQFKGQANTVAALTAKDKILRQEIEQQTEKVRALEQALKDAAKVFGEDSKKVSEYQEKLNRAQIDLINMNQALGENTKYLQEAKDSATGAATSIDAFGRQVKETERDVAGLGDSTGTLKDQLKVFLDEAGIGSGVLNQFGGNLKFLGAAGAAGIAVAGLSKVVGAITELEESTREYRRIMGTLEASSRDAGYSAEETAQVYGRLQAVLGDTQTAATAAANLQAIGFSQKDLMAITDAAIGAWAKYGDSIPIDSLAEAINETIQVGKVTGTFADALNWAGVNEDLFNERLQAAGDAAERANIVLKQLSDQGLVDAAESWFALNEDIAGANEAQEKMDAALARLGERLAPITEGLKSLGGDALNGLMDFFDHLTGSAEAATSELEEFQAKIKEVIAETEAAADSAKDSAQGLLSMAESIVTLSEAEDRSNLQQQAMLELIDELNQKIPGLNLAYDEQTGHLNMTADALRNVTAAEGERLVQSEAAARYNDLLREQATIAAQIEEAEISLEKARAANEAAKERVIQNGKEVILVNSELGKAQWEAVQILAKLRDKYDELQIALDQLESEYGDLETVSGSAAASTDGMAESVQDAADAQREAAEAAAELEEATLYLSGAADTLAEALKEQSKEGSLSYQTTQDLIEAGYGAALAIDEETGAVTLNRAEYINLTNAKINDQIAALETQRQSQITSGRLEAEAMSAQHAGSAYWEMAAAKLYAEGADTTAIDAQIAALNRLRSNLSNVTTEATRASRASRSASKQAKTQAEEDLEAYKRLKAELDHQKNTELVDEAEYYRKMAEYRDQYLRDEANVSEYRKVTEQIFQYDKDLAEREMELWEDQSDKLLDEFDKRIDGVAKEQERLENKLGGYGDLFSMEKDRGSGKERMELESLQEQIDAINAYENALSRLKERGASGGLLDEILGMGVDEATQYAGKLLAMSDAQWDQYNDLFDEKQRRAIEVAEQYFKDQMDALETEYTTKLGDALDSLTDTSFTAGVNTGRELIGGLASMEEALYSQAQEMANRVSEILAGAGRIPSNSELAASFSTDRIREQFNGVTPQQLQNVGVGMVNAMNTLNGAPQPLSITIQTEDKLTIARAFVPDIRTASRENPETLDDK